MKSWLKISWNQRILTNKQDGLFLLTIIEKSAASRGFLDLQWILLAFALPVKFSFQPGGPNKGRARYVILAP